MHTLCRPQIPSDFNHCTKCQVFEHFALSHVMPNANVFPYRMQMKMGMGGRHSGGGPSPFGGAGPFTGGGSMGGFEFTFVGGGNPFMHMPPSMGAGGGPSIYGSSRCHYSHLTILQSCCPACDELDSYRAEKMTLCCQVIREQQSLWATSSLALAKAKLQGKLWLSRMLLLRSISIV